MSGTMMIPVVDLDVLHQIAEQLGIESSPLIGMMVLLWIEMYRVGVTHWPTLDLMNRIEGITTREANDVIDILAGSGFIERINESDLVRVRIPFVKIDGGAR